MKLRDRLARIASTGLNVPPETLTFTDGRIFAADNPENAIPLRRAAGIAHWSPGSLPENTEPGLRETVFWSMPGLDPPDENDRVNSSGAYGFIFDMCGVEVDATGRVRIDEYVTMHDAGKRLNPALVDGQIRGAFAHGVGAQALDYAGYREIDRRCDSCSETAGILHPECHEATEPGSPSRVLRGSEEYSGTKEEGTEGEEATAVRASSQEILLNRSLCPPFDTQYLGFGELLGYRFWC